MKKIISILLVISIIFSFSMSALAVNSKFDDKQDTILLKYDGHGQYKITSGT